LAGKFKDFDYCYAISVPLTIGIAAMRIKSRYKIPFIFEVGDLWPEAPIQMGFVNNYLLKRLLYTLEKTIYKRAQSIVALSSSIKTEIEKKVPGKQVFTIPNMADTDFYQPEPKETRWEEKYHVKGKFVVSYIGALGIANGLDFFLECARASQKANLPVHFLLCGDGAMLDHLTRTKIQLQLNNLSIIPFQDRQGVREVMNVTDASFICYKPVPVLETGSPNKFFDALAASKVVIVNFGGWIQSEIEAQRCGFHIHSNRPTEFVNKINVLLEDRIQLEEMKKASRLLAEKKYSRTLLSKEFVDLFSR
jgi:glycosyltransferase involved in cell wall biosynthesis